jgi:LacI family transcriptional regulator
MYTCTIPDMKPLVKKNTAAVTRDMVAHAAGVSSATVSRVYNNPSSVSRQKRTAVLESAQLLGYVPNKAASALRRTGTGVITLVEFDKGSRPYYWNAMPAFNWFYGDVIKGVKSVIDSTMYHLNLETVTDLKQLDTLQDQCDALLLFDIDDPREADAVRRLSTPYVAAHHTGSYDRLWSCSTDNRAGGELQAEELDRLGVHRPIYVTSYHRSVQPHAERLEGFLQQWDSTHEERAIVIEAEQSAYELSEKLPEIYQCLKDGADGIACVNDRLLLRLFSRMTTGHILRECELPAVGYDASPLSDIVPYRYSSVDIRQKLIYQRAAGMLLDRLSDPSSGRILQEVIPPVIVRGV